MTQQALPLVGEAVTVESARGPYQAKVVALVPEHEWVTIPEHPARIRIPPEDHPRAVVYDDEMHVWAAVPVWKVSL